MVTASADVIFIIVNINRAFVLSLVDNSQGSYNNGAGLILMDGFFLVSITMSFTSYLWKQELMHIDDDK